MGGFGDFFSNKSTQSGSTSGTTRASFTGEGKETLDAFRKRLDQPGAQQTQGVGDARSKGVYGLANTNIQAKSVQPQIQQQVGAIQQQYASQLPQQIAQARSQSYNAPVGRGDINVADTIARNQAGSEAQIANVYSDAAKFDSQADLDAQKQQANVNQSLINTQDLNRAEDSQANAQKDAQYMQLLSLLRGEDQTGTSQSAGKARDSYANIIGGTAGGIMGAFCWLARAVFGADSPLWLRYRVYILNIAPFWYKVYYFAFARQLAPVVRRCPWLRKKLYKKMLKTLDKNKGLIDFFVEQERKLLEVIISN